MFGVEVVVETAAIVEEGEEGHDPVIGADRGCKEESVTFDSQPVAWAMDRIEINGRVEDDPAEDRVKIHC